MTSSNSVGWTTDGAKDLGDDNPFLDGKDPNHDLDCVKYWLEDISSIDGVVARLGQIAERYKGLAADGWQLTSPVEDGDLYLARNVVIPEEPTC